VLLGALIGVHIVVLARLVPAGDVAPATVWQAVIVITLCVVGLAVLALAVRVGQLLTELRRRPGGGAQ
jgi:NAD/NADP transhydrogenase alpha subunit